MQLVKELVRIRDADENCCLRSTGVAAATVVTTLVRISKDTIRILSGEHCIAGDHGPAQDMSPVSRCLFAARLESADSRSAIEVISLEVSSWTSFSHF